MKKLFQEYEFILILIAMLIFGYKNLEPHIMFYPVPFFIYFWGKEKRNVKNQRELIKKVEMLEATLANKVL